MSKVILVDDDKNQLFLNTILLKEENIFQHIETFHNPIDAVEFIKEKLDPKNDVIVVDIHMPQMSAWEFLNMIGQDLDDNAKGDLSLFIASHSANPKDVEKANQHVLVNKFIDKFDLVDEIKNYVKDTIAGRKRLAVRNT